MPFIELTDAGSYHCAFGAAHSGEPLAYRDSGAEGAALFHSCPGKAEGLPLCAAPKARTDDLPD